MTENTNFGRGGGNTPFFRFIGGHGSCNQDFRVGHLRDGDAAA